MKIGTSSLNPHAASYIPLSRRGTDASKGYPLPAKDSMSGNETVWLGPHSDDTAQNQSKVSQNYIAHGTMPSEDYTLKENSVHGSYGSSSQNSIEMAERKILEEEFDMDLIYLQMTFPGVSQESLSDIYWANKGDLETTVDMLYHFELSSENLLDTLEIGDESGSGSSSESASLKLKKVAGEVAGSSSDSSGSARDTPN